MIKNVKLCACTVVAAAMISAFTAPALAKNAARPSSSAGASSRQSSSSMASSKSSENPASSKGASGKEAEKTNYGCHMFGHVSAVDLLSEISGKTESEIRNQYPQKTSWQAAKAMGKLDDLKKAYTARGKVMIDKLVENKRITAQDGGKMYADLQKRVAAIDGVNIVVSGRPGFIPQLITGGH